MSTARRTPSELLQNLPHKENGRLDKARCREIYDASPFIEWRPFCRSVNWPLEYCYINLPQAEWVKEKRERKYRDIAEDLKEFTISHKGTWLEDLKQTVGQYPRLIDNLMIMIASAIKDSVQSGRALSPLNIATLATAAKTCVEAKKSLLFLNEVTVEIEKTIPAQLAEEEKQWVMKLRGGKEMSARELSQLMLSYLDKPSDTGERDADS